MVQLSLILTCSPIYHVQFGNDFASVFPFRGYPKSFGISFHDVDGARNIHEDLCFPSRFLRVFHSRQKSEQCENYFAAFSYNRFEMKCPNHSEAMQCSYKFLRQVT